jgi:hypothetical protein
MRETQSWFAGVDWASENHDVWLADASGKRLGKRTFEHSGEGLAHVCAWLIATSGGKPEDMHVAIEVPHGAVVETLLGRGFKVFAINPKQLDRFRDRFSPSGAKDDSRDAETFSSLLRPTSAHSIKLRLPALSLSSCVNGRVWPMSFGPIKSGIPIACASSFSVDASN